MVAERLSDPAFLAEACTVAGATPGVNKETELRSFFAQVLENAARDTRRKREEASSSPSAISAFGSVVRFRDSVAGSSQKVQRPTPLKSDVTQEVTVVPTVGVRNDVGSGSPSHDVMQSVAVSPTHFTSSTAAPLRKGLL